MGNVKRKAGEETVKGKFALYVVCVIFKRKRTNTHHIKQRDDSDLKTARSYITTSEKKMLILSEYMLTNLSIQTHTHT